MDLFRRPARIPLLLAFALVVPACGGGSGGGGDAGLAGGAEPAPTATAAERDRAILEGCALEGIEAWEAVAADFDGTLDGETYPAPDFQVTGIDLLAASIGWTLDAQPDGQIDLQGTLRFFDGGGSPAFPF